MAADPAAPAELRAHLDRLGADIAAVDARAANTRAGYVYVISNIGSFGDQVVKIGMTRRLEPMDRVRELGDASVPLRFDDHALVFSDDAVGLEGRLHAALADRPVNKVNQHREFFRTTPGEVRRLLADAAGSHLLEFTETVEALEWRASGATTRSLASRDRAITASFRGRRGHPREPNDTGTPALREMSPGRLVPLDGVQHLRLLLQVTDDRDVGRDHPHPAPAGVRGTRRAPGQPRRRTQPVRRAHPTWPGAHRHGRPAAPGQRTAPACRSHPDEQRTLAHLLRKLLLGFERDQPAPAPRPARRATGRHWPRQG
jgi:hypothetical protein